MTDTFGELDAQLLKFAREYKTRCASAVRRMGDGYEPHVDDVTGRLVYSLSVDSGFVSTSFSFVIDIDDLSILVSDPYRRAVSEMVAHEVLQSSMGRGNPEVTRVAFGRLFADIMHSTLDDLSIFVAATSCRHNTAVAMLVEQTMARRNLAVGH